MIYELRTYWAAPGKLDALQARFRDLTLGVFARHNMQVVGFWVPEPRTPETGDLLYILAFPSQEAMAAAWAAFRQDQQWIQGKEASERDGALVARIASQVLLPTDYSPLQ